MKDKVEMPTKTLEQKIAGIMASNDASSDAIGTLMGEIEKAVSEPTMTDRLRLSLPELQQQFAAARKREEMVHWQQEYERLDALSDQGAETLPRYKCTSPQSARSFLRPKPLPRSVPNSTSIRLPACMWSDLSLKPAGSPLSLG